MKTKKFDCVKMKDEAQQRRANTLRGLSANQRLQFHRELHAKLCRRREELRRRAESNP